MDGEPLLRQDITDITRHYRGLDPEHVRSFAGFVGAFRSEYGLPDKVDFTSPLITDTFVERTQALADDGVPWAVEALRVFLEVHVRPLCKALTESGEYSTERMARELNVHPRHVAYYLDRLEETP